MFSQRRSIVFLLLCAVLGGIHWEDILGFGFRKIFYFYT